MVSYDTAFFGLAGQGCFASALREFNISDPAVALAELGAHLKRSFSDVYSLSWQRFEDLVADVFRCNYASDVIQTARSADGGADMLLLSRDGKSVDAVGGVQTLCTKPKDQRRISEANDWGVRRLASVARNDSHIQQLFFECHELGVSIQTGRFYNRSNRGQRAT